MEAHCGRDVRAARRLTGEELAALAAELRAAPVLALCTDADGGREAPIRGIGLAWAPGRSGYVPVRREGSDGAARPDAALVALRPLLEDESVPKCGHNLKIAAGQLLRAGVRLRGVVFDSMLACTILDPSARTGRLSGLAEAHLGHMMAPEPAEEDADLPERCAERAVEAAETGLRLYHEVMPRLEAMNLDLLLREVEAPLCTVLAEMERNGIRCDPDELRRQGEALAARVQELRAEIIAAAGCEFHPDSPKQIEEVLFDRLGFESGKKTKTGRSTDHSVLEKLAAQEDRRDPRTSVPRLVLEYRHLQKLISTYLGNLIGSVNPATGRIHSSFYQLVIATGRLSSYEPNMQTIPVKTEVGRQIRKAFSAPPGWRLICADYSQVELRLLAHLSQDAGLCDAFARDDDIHTSVAAQVFGVAPEAVTRQQRTHAKTINFGIVYGVTAFGLSQRIEGLDRSTAKKLITDYKARFPGIDRFLKECIDHALEQGYVCTLLGRRRLIPELTSSNRMTRALGERLAINSVVQGSGADLIKAAMVRLQRRIDRDGLPLKLLLQIHDELVLETPEELAEEHARLVCEEMKAALPLSVPLKAEAGIGRDWMSAK